MTIKPHPELKTFCAEFRRRFPQCASYRKENLDNPSYMNRECLTRDLLVLLYISKGRPSSDEELPPIIDDLADNFAASLKGKVL